MQRITDIWRNLVTYYDDNNNVIDREQQIRERADQTEHDEIEDNYRNQYWIGVVSLQNNQDENITKSELAQAIIDSLNEV